MSATDYLEKKLVDHSLGVAAYTMPSAVYMALHTSQPSDAGAGGEVIGGTYAPQPIAFGGATLGTGQGASTNSQTFTGMPAVTVTHFTLRENTGGGQPLYVGAMSTPITVTAGAALTFTPGQIKVTGD